MKICLSCGFTTTENIEFCPECKAIAHCLRKTLATELEAERDARFWFRDGHPEKAEKILHWLGYEKLPCPADPGWQKPTTNGVKVFYL